MGNLFSDIFNFILSPPGLLILAIIIVSAVIIYYVYRKMHEEEFVLEKFEDRVFEDIEKSIDLFGKKVKGFLVRGFDEIGYVSAYLHVKGKHYPLIFDEKTGKVRSDEKTKAIEYDLYIFQIGHKMRILRFFHIGDRYAIVDKKFITNLDPYEKRITWNINKDIQFMKWANVFVGSQSAEEYITDIAIKRSHENTVTYLMNYARKIIYLEMTHAKKIDIYSTKQSIKAKHIREYKKAEGEDSEGDEDD